jgi:hypothetical protein
MRRNWQHTGKPTQPTRPKGRDKQGKPYQPVQTPMPRRREFFEKLSRVAEPEKPSKTEKSS